MTPLENFYEKQDEPNRGCLLALKGIILSQDECITPEWKYSLPFFYYKGKMFCYLWIHKKSKQPYVGIVEGQHIQHPLLVAEKTARMKKIFINPNEDLPIKELKKILQEALMLYKSGKIKTK